LRAKELCVEVEKGPTLIASAGASKFASLITPLRRC
jgi:hypothetical protein